MPKVLVMVGVRHIGEDSYYRPTMRRRWSLGNRWSLKMLEQTTYHIVIHCGKPGLESFAHNFWVSAGSSWDK